MNKSVFILIAVLSLLSFADCSKGGNRSDSADSALSSDTTADAASHRSALPDTVTFAFVGDVMMGTTFPDSVNGTHLPVDEGRHLFDASREILRRVDFAAMNHEGTLLDGPGQRRPMGNPKTYFVFRVPTSWASNLVDAGFDFVGIANNHINDFGEPGRKSTCETLERAGLAHAGLKGRCEYAIVERRGVRAGFTQFGHGDNNLDVNDLDEVHRVVKLLRDSCDIVVVTFHGGAEGADYAHVPSEMETYVGERRGDVKAFAHAAIDAGADMVIGHGPHVVRGAEMYKGKPVFYSLGNFCTPFRMGVSGYSGQAPVVEIATRADGGFLSAKVHSFVQRRGEGPVADPSDAAAKRIVELSKEDFGSAGPLSK